jgi:hypothetical protein
MQLLAAGPETRGAEHETTSGLRDGLLAATSGWRVWQATARLAVVRWHREGVRLTVTLQEAGAQHAAGTGLTLGSGGRCVATHTNSPSLLHCAQVGGDVRTVPRDRSRSEVTLEPGGVLIQMTAGLLGAVPPKEIAELPRRMARRRSLATLAGDLVRLAAGRPDGDSAGVVVVTRVSPSGW